MPLLDEVNEKRLSCCLLTRVRSQKDEVWLGESWGGGVATQEFVFGHVKFETLLKHPWSDTDIQDSSSG